MWVLAIGLAGLVILPLAGTVKFLHYTEGDLSVLLHDSRCGNSRTRKLILMLDGVPYETVHRLWLKGYFRIFNRPSRVIAPFPSMTNVSAAELWRAAPPDGYESLYFDRASNSLAGGAETYLRKRAVADSDYHRLLDYVEPRAFEFIVYGFPGRINRADMRRFLLAYAASEKPIFKAFLKSTDGLTHIGGKGALEKSLVRLDILLSRLYRERGGRLEIVLFSDHGNRFARPRRVDLEGHLARRGFYVRGQFEGENTVVIPGFGLVGYAALHTAPSSRRRVAEAIAEMAGVLVAYSDGQDVYVLGGNSVARISHNQDNNSYRYQALRGDPLEIAEIIDRMRRKGKMTPDDYVSDQVWFEALEDHRYPDAIFRLYQGAKGLVRNRADILVSFEEGLAYGSRLLEAYSGLVPVVAIHGGLEAAQSQGFFMSTAFQAPPSIRAREVSEHLNPWHCQEGLWGRSALAASVPEIARD